MNKQNKIINLILLKNNNTHRDWFKFKKIYILGTKIFWASGSVLNLKESAKLLNITPNTWNYICNVYPTHQLTVYPCIHTYRLPIYNASFHTLYTSLNWKKKKARKKKMMKTLVFCFAFIVRLLFSMLTLWYK